MSFEQNLLLALTDRQKFRVLSEAVPPTVSAETRVLLKWYKKYFKAVPSGPKLDLGTLKEMIKLKSKDKEGADLLIALVNSLEAAEPDEEALAAVGEQLAAEDLRGKIGAVLARYDDDDEVDLAFECMQLADATLRSTGRQSAHEYEDTPIEELLAEIDKDEGLKFRRWPTFYHGLVGIMPGISVAVAARPDKGKSSLVASIATDWAPQAAKLWGTQRPMLWLNNEGKGRRLIPRIYQAALGASTEQLIKWSNDKSLRKRYERAIGAPYDFIRVKDMHGAKMAEIERVISAVRPSVVFADMLSNFHVGGPIGAKHEEVQQIWVMMRELAARYDFVSVGTIQISQEGANMLYPPQSALKDSKTGVQGAVDLLLMAGNYEAENSEIRGFSTTKNKLQKSGHPTYLKASIHFDSALCDFTEVE